MNEIEQNHYDLADYWTQRLDKLEDSMQLRIDHLEDALTQIVTCTSSIEHNYAKQYHRINKIAKEGLMK